MSTPRSRSGGSGKSGTPQSLPEGTPSHASPHDHSFTLQAVMEMQKSVAVLGEKIDRMGIDIGSMSGKLDAANDKMDRLKHWQTTVTAGAIVVAALAGIIWSIITFVPWDRIQIVPEPVTTQPAANTPPTSAIPAKP